MEPPSRDDICSDIIFEILSRTPLQRIAKCRLLSKDHNSLTYESNFIQLHSTRTKTVSGFFIQGYKKNKHISTFVSTEDNFSEAKINLDFLPYPAKIEACSKQGIILCSSEYPRETSYYICKPSTKQYEVLPSPNSEYFTHTMGMVGLGRNNNSLWFKLVRLSYSEFGSASSYKCEVFDSRDWMWKELEDVTLPYFEYLFNSIPALSICGAIQWITSEKRVLSFDVEKQSWEFFPLPKPAYQGGYSNYLELVEYEGKLALILPKERDNVELWVMERYNNKEWCKKHRFDFEEVRAFYNSDVALIKGFYKVEFYKFKNGKRRDVVEVDDHMFPEQVFFFQSDLEPADFKEKVADRLLSSSRFPASSTVC